MPVPAFDDGVDLDPLGLAVVLDPSAERLCVEAGVAHDERLEEVPERIGGLEKPRDS
ncbi:MAG: hypothetical protein AB1Z63_06835 [Candidatus Limnocylindrales bacterium]